MEKKEVICLKDTYLYLHEEEKSQESKLGLLALYASLFDYIA